MTPQEYAKFKQSLKETQQRGQRMLQRIEGTLTGVRETITQIQENEANIVKFEKAFEDVMGKLAEKLAGSFGAKPFKKVEGKIYEYMPKEISFNELAKRLLEHKSIAIVTGAGVSAPSGIPTFRGQGGLYSKKFEWQGKSYEPQEFITRAFYEKHPQAIWQWVDSIYTMSQECKANPIHYAVHQLATALGERKKEVAVVTQNIDGLHLEPKKEEYIYSQCHGHVSHIRCQENHLHPYAQFRKDIKTGQKVPCQKCGSPLRPHVLFFDESYGPLYGDAVKQKTFPMVIVIGSSLSTGLCCSMVGRAEEVVEINPYPVMEVGKVYQYKGDTADTLQSILKALGEGK